MSDSPLADDLARWTTNPHELLGVPSRVGSRELKRAYHRLIRIYKPEQFPEQFRRTWANLLNTDWPLRHVDRACQLSLTGG